LIHGGAATNLAAAVGKIPVTALTVRLFVIIKMLTVHEVDLFPSLLRELNLVPTNILAESNVVLLEEVMIVQGRAVFKACQTTNLGWSWSSNRRDVM